MSDDTTDAVDDTTTDGSMEVQTTALTSSYKVLGQFNADNGVGVLGQNDAESGTPIGVQGAVPNASAGYGLYTAQDAFVGTRLETTHVDTAGSDYRVAAGTTATGQARNVVQGHASNEITAGVVGATIAGGGWDDASTSNTNRVHDEFGTVGGGYDNQAGRDDGITNTDLSATVCGGASNTASRINSFVGGGDSNTAAGEAAVVTGGRGNTASLPYSTIAGGESNSASDQYSTVAGGFGNTATGVGAAILGGGSNSATGQSSVVAGGGSNSASGDSSFAAGNDAKANDTGSFVWADDQGSDFASDQPGAAGSSPTGSNTFHVRATGGVRLVTGLDGSNDPNAGAYLSAGGSSWQTVSARAAKQRVDPVDPEDVLAGVEDVEISTWEYKSNPGVRRMGPMAGDFHDAFELGNDPETIGHVDADGVALAAIQGLAERLEETREDLESKDARIEELEEQTERLPGLEATADHVEDLEAENDRLRDRLSALEDRVASLAGGPSDSGVTADD